MTLRQLRCEREECKWSTDPERCPQCEKPGEGIAEGWCVCGKRWTPGQCIRCGAPLRPWTWEDVEIEAPPDLWPTPEREEGDADDPLSLLDAPMTMLLREVQNDWRKLGKDAGGNPTVVEQERLLDRYKIDDPDERELHCDLQDAITAAKEEVMAERFGQKPGAES